MEKETPSSEENWGPEHIKDLKKKKTRMKGYAVRSWTLMVPRSRRPGPRNRSLKLELRIGVILALVPVLGLIIIAEEVNPGRVGVQNSFNATYVINLMSDYAIVFPKCPYRDTSKTVEVRLGRGSSVSQIYSQAASFQAKQNSQAFGDCPRFSFLVFAAVTLVLRFGTCDKLYKVLNKQRRNRSKRKLAENVSHVKNFKTFSSKEHEKEVENSIEFSKEKDQGYKLDAFKDDDVIGKCNERLNFNFSPHKNLGKSKDCVENANIPSKNPDEISTACLQNIVRSVKNTIILPLTKLNGSQSSWYQINSSCVPHSILEKLGIFSVKNAFYVGILCFLSTLAAESYFVPDCRETYGSRCTEVLGVILMCICGISILRHWQDTFLHWFLASFGVSRLLLVLVLCCLPMPTIPFILTDDEENDFEEFTEVVVTDESDICFELDDATVLPYDVEEDDAGLIGLPHQGSLQTNVAVECLCDSQRKDEDGMSVWNGIKYGDKAEMEMFLKIDPNDFDPSKKVGIILSEAASFQAKQNSQAFGDCPRFSFLVFAAVTLVLRFGTCDKLYKVLYKQRRNRSKRKLAENVSHVKNFKTFSSKEHEKEVENSIEFSKEKDQGYKLDAFKDDDVIGKCNERLNFNFNPHKNLGKSKNCVENENIPSKNPDEISTVCLQNIVRSVKNTSTLPLTKPNGSQSSRYNSQENFSIVTDDRTTLNVATGFPSSDQKSDINPTVAPEESSMDGIKEEVVAYSHHEANQLDNFSDFQIVAHCLKRLLLRKFGATAFMNEQQAAFDISDDDKDMPETDTEFWYNDGGCEGTVVETPKTSEISRDDASINGVTQCQLPCSVQSHINYKTEESESRVVDKDNTPYDCDKCEKEKHNKKSSVSYKNQGRRNKQKKRLLSGEKRKRIHLHKQREKNRGNYDNFTADFTSLALQGDALVRPNSYGKSNYGTYKFADDPASSCVPHSILEKLGIFNVKNAFYVGILCFLPTSAAESCFVPDCRETYGSRCIEVLGVILMCICGISILRHWQDTFLHWFLASFGVSRLLLVLVLCCFPMPTIPFIPTDDEENDFEESTEGMVVTDESDICFELDDATVLPYDVEEDDAGLIGLPHQGSLQTNVAVECLGDSQRKDEDDMSVWNGMKYGDKAEMEMFLKIDPNDFDPSKKVGIILSEEHHCLSPGGDYNCGEEYDYNYDYPIIYAKGGYGDVSVFQDKRTAYDFVIKKLNLFSKEELLVPLRLGKQGITPELTGCFWYQGKMNILMQFCKGECLAKAKCINKISCEEVALLLFELLSKLQHFHNHDAVIYDLKEQNLVLVNGDDVSTLRLIDFGAVKWDIFPWRSGGDTPIMAPPNWRKIEKEGKVTDCVKTKDLWNVGTVVYFLMTGDNLFDPVWDMLGRKDAHFSSLDSSLNRKLGERPNEASQIRLWKRSMIKEMIEKCPQYIEDGIKKLSTGGRISTRGSSLRPFIIDLLKNLLHIHDKAFTVEDALQHSLFRELRRHIVSHRRAHLYSELNMNELCPPVRVKPISCSLAVNFDGTMVYYTPVEKMGTKIGYFLNGDHDCVKNIESNVKGRDVEFYVDGHKADMNQNIDSSVTIDVILVNGAEKKV